MPRHVNFATASQSTTKADDVILLLGGIADRMQPDAARAFGKKKDSILHSSEGAKAIARNWFCGTEAGNRGDDLG